MKGTFVGRVQVFDGPDVTSDTYEVLEISDCKPEGGDGAIEIRIPETEASHEIFLWIRLKDLERAAK